MPEINKATRHPKITGNFAENLILYWLSKHGFECAIIDHTGIDIIARKPKSEDVMGISVKGRSKTKKAKGTYIGIHRKDFPKVQKACEAFKCKPYFAIVSDESDKIYAYILPMEKLLELYPNGKKICAWQMSSKKIEKYRKDSEIKNFELVAKTITWW